MTFEASRERKGRGSRDSSSRGNSRGRDSRGSGRGDSRGRDSRGSGRGDSRGRDSGGYGRDRSSGGYGRDRGELTMTRVTCSGCGQKCEVPFKPTSNKPVYCSACFKNIDDSSSSNNSNKISEKDIDMINKKLNKIMKALNIE